jgi:hypothetical protein
MLKFFIILVLLILFINICKKSNKILNNISALSYLRVNHNVPHKELIDFFIRNYSEDKYQKYINLVKSINKLPVYVIKKINDKYEFEIYFYRYDPDRKTTFKVKNANYMDIKLDNLEKFPSKKEFDLLKVKPYNNKLFKDNKFIICSYDVNENFFTNNDKITYNYYFDNEKDKLLYRYVTIEEDYQGIIKETNQYGLYYSIFKDINDKKKYLINLFESDDCIIFYAYKPNTNSNAFYFENLSFEKFIFFLKYFKYDLQILEFCLKNYDDSYRFCVSYDMDNNGNILKTAIFSLLD